jgi:hypothetical protein
MITLQLFTKIIKQKVFTIVIKMLSWKAFVKRQSGPVKNGGKQITLIKIENLP